MPDGALPAVSLVTSAATAAGFWQMGILWNPLISGESTRGTYSLMEQLMPAKAGPPPHVHDQGEEVYILDGELALQLGEEVITGTRASWSASRPELRTRSRSGPRRRGC